MSRELGVLGEQPGAEADGGVGWQGDARSVMRANLWLRTATRVVVRVAQFEATAFHELERLAKRIPWQQYVAPGQAVEFRVTAKKSRLYHSQGIAERLTKAAARAIGPRGADAGAPEAQLFVVRVVRDEFTISADSSGPLLHMRGYRQALARAPLRETLAAALLLASDWDGRTPLVDPLCGSGTIPIEAALIARRIAPGLFRRFAFEHWPGFDAAAWRRLKAEAADAMLASSPAVILGTDRDEGAIRSGRANADRAGVGADVAFAVRAISDVGAPPGCGLVATNPPYGVRVGERGALRDLYARLGQELRVKFGGWRLAMFSASARLTDEVGIPVLGLFRTSNGGIPVRGVLGDVPKYARGRHSS